LRLGWQRSSGDGRLAIPVFALAILVRDGKPRCAMRWPCAAAAVGVGALLLHNAVLFGGPFQFGTLPQRKRQAPEYFRHAALEGLYDSCCLPQVGIYFRASLAPGAGWPAPPLEYRARCRHRGLLIP